MAEDKNGDEDVEEERNMELAVVASSDRDLEAGERSDSEGEEVRGGVLIRSVS